MRKGFVVLMTTGIALTGSGIALADIVPVTYSSGITQNKFVESKSWTDILVGKTYTFKSYSTFPYGTWNSQYMFGVGDYDFDKSHENAADVNQINIGGRVKFNTKLEACDWCHRNGASSGLNIQMDNDDNYSTGYDAGRTKNYGIKSSKRKAPDCAYPVFVANYWLGGFACFDYQSPLINPERVINYNSDGRGAGQEISYMISLVPVYNDQYTSQALLSGH